MIHHELNLGQAAASAQHEQLASPAVTAPEQTVGRTALLEPLGLAELATFADTFLPNQKGDFPAYANAASQNGPFGSHV